MSRLVSFLVGARSPAVEQRVQGLLLPAPRQAPQALAARPRVHAARRALGEGARQAAAAAGLLDQLAAAQYRRAHGQRLLVTRLARHVRAQAARQPQDECQQEAKPQKHCRCRSSAAASSSSSWNINVKKKMHLSYFFPLLKEPKNVEWDES